MQAVGTDSEGREVAIRLRLQWQYVLSVIGAGVMTLIVMWASLGKLTEQVSELKVAVQAGNTIMATLQNDVNLLKYRQEVTEKRLESFSSPSSPATNSPSRR